MSKILSSGTKIIRGFFNVLILSRSYQLPPTIPDIIPAKDQEAAAVGRTYAMESVSRRGTVKSFQYTTADDL